MSINMTSDLLNYDSMVDITVFFILTVFMLIALNSTHIKDFGLNCLRGGIVFVMLSTFIKYTFFITLNNTGGTQLELLTYILYYVYNILNISTVGLYIEYLLNVIGRRSKFSKGIRAFYHVIIGSSILNSFLKGVQGKVLGYAESQDVWFIVSRGFTFEIALFGLLILGLFVLIVNKQHFIKQVYVTLLFTNILNLVLFIVSSSLNDVSFVNLILLLPFLVIVLMLYTVPYNFQTGALTFTNFERYLFSRKHKKISYVVIHFTNDITGITFSRENGKFLYTFWREYFLHCFFFEVNSNMYVLAIEDDFINKTHLDAVIKNELIPFVNTLNLDYKLYGVMDVDYIENISEFLNLDLYFRQSVETNSYKVFEDTILEKARYITDIVTELQDIVEKHDLNDERVLVYCQPVKNIKTNRFDTAEALMRLQLKKVGFIYPDMFIPLAEAFNYIHVLSLIILNKTCATIRKLLDEGYIVERISVNFCVKEFKEDSFCDEILSIISNNHIPFDKIAIELTESKNEEDYTLILEKINKLKEYGIKFYLDDFGTGYSNFDRILGLNLDIVKFDKSLLDMAETNKNTKFVLTHFSSAFKKLDYQILFEGVETDSQINICMASDADYLQGYKYSKPIGIEHLTEFFSKTDEVVQE